MPDSASNAHHISGWRRLVLWPLAAVLQLWGRSLRFEIPEADRRVFERQDTPVAFAVWHNRLFLVPEFYRRYRGGRPIYCLISASKDGAWLAAFLSLIGMRVVRGSSSRMGREAASELVEVIKAGNDIGVTPDGPRGPCYDFKPGIVTVARRTKAPVLLTGGQFGSAKRLRSWDGFYLPLPFSRVRVRCEVAIPDDGNAAAIAARFRELNPD